MTRHIIMHTKVLSAYNNVHIWINFIKEEPPQYECPRAKEAFKLSSFTSVEVFKQEKGNRRKSIVIWVDVSKWTISEIILFINTQK